jgi:hypothetical protein
VAQRYRQGERRQKQYVILSAVLLTLLLAACAPPQPPAPTPDAVNTVGQARTTDGPVLWAQGDRLISAWVGANEREVFQVARLGDAEPVILPLPPRHPFAQQGYNAVNGRLHLLWLDAGEDGANQLYTALLSPNLQVERGPTPVSEVFTQRYAALPATNGSMTVAWSGGLPTEPSLYLQQIDNDGRPLQAERIALNADWPALVATDVAPLLYWLDRESGDLWRASSEGSATTRLTSGVRLDTGDRISGVVAATQGDSHVFVWNVTRADGSDESWASAGAAEASTWPAPQPLQVTEDGETQAVRWLAFAPAGDRAQAAAQVGDDVGLLGLEGATVSDFTPLATLDADLIGPMRLLALADDRLVLAWAEPGPDGAALRVGVVE